MKSTSPALAAHLAGAVVLNQASSPQRRNFSLAHELGHFLNPWHKPVGEGGFRCSRGDMLSSDERSIQNRHLRQEAEANRFAIELLVPARFMKPFMRSETDMEQIVAAAAALDISKAAAAQPEARQRRRWLLPTHPALSRVARAEISKKKEGGWAAHTRGQCAPPKTILKQYVMSKGRRFEKAEGSFPKTNTRSHNR